MEKQRIIENFILYAFGTSLEIGFFIEVMWHGFAGFGAGNVMEYNEKGNTGISFLLFFIPICVIIIYLIRIIKLFMKKNHNVKEYMKESLFLDFRCALFCIPITIAITLAFGIYFNPITSLGRMIASFLIDHFNWMDYVF
ncbi:MAG: hypothetical protein NC231_14230 [Bacillus sp. (in: Bacteria)]|nr:hypothetical protein [Bacillus sp. (in: firmicutes)]MCM1426219.1 hypothetical protein [Eubacterium sp.]